MGTSVFTAQNEHEGLKAASNWTMFYTTCLAIKLQPKMHQMPMVIFCCGKLKNEKIYLLLGGESTLNGHQAIYSWKLLQFVTKEVVKMLSIVTLPLPINNCGRIHSNKKKYLMHAVQKLQKYCCESSLRWSNLTSTVCESVPKWEPFLFNQHFEAIYGPIVGVKHEFC